MTRILLILASLLTLQGCVIPLGAALDAMGAKHDRQISDISNTGK